MAPSNARRAERTTFSHPRHKNQRLAFGRMPNCASKNANSNNGRHHQPGFIGDAVFPKNSFRLQIATDPGIPKRYAWGPTLLKLGRGYIKSPVYGRLVSGALSRQVAWHYAARDTEGPWPWPVSFKIAGEQFLLPHQADLRLLHSRL